jgi:hypothetical protein
MHTWVFEQAERDRREVRGLREGPHHVAPVISGHRPTESSRSGLEESGGQTMVDAKRPKSIMSEGATRPSLIDFSEAETTVSPILHSRDLFGSFFDLAKNERPCEKTSACLNMKEDL